MNSPELIWILPCLLAVIAFLYASVGHGGASGYLALMALAGISPALMKSSALLLNVLVSLIAFIQFARQGHFHWKKFWPFALTSLPFSYLGAMMTIDSSAYKIILGLLLIFPVLRILGVFGKGETETKEINLALALVAGAAIGFLSGLIGIGGGILLSPLLILLRWADLKQSAAVSALFIFVNSVSGMAGLMTKGVSFPPSVYTWLVAAVLGGALGAYFGSARMPQAVLKGVLATVLLVASVKLFIV